MKKIYLLLVMAICIYVSSCRNAETKADRENDKAGEEAKPVESAEPIPDTNSTKSGTTRGLEIGNEPNEILTNIDNYLVSKASFTNAGADGGVMNGSVTVENTLPDATIQKAFIEVSILLADGKEFRTDYYTMQNIEPGGKKTVKIPNTIRGTSVVCHVVKLKSAELTKGEMILVGSRYVPN